MLLCPVVPGEISPLGPALSGAAVGSRPFCRDPADGFRSKALVLREKAPTGARAQKTHSHCLLVYSNSDGNSAGAMLLAVTWAQPWADS